MVEYQHPAGAGCLGDEAYGFRIINAAQLVLVIEVLDRAAMLDMSQPFTVEREATRDRPCIMNQHDMRFRNASRLRRSGRRVIGEGSSAFPPSARGNLEGPRHAAAARSRHWRCSSFIPPRVGRRGSNFSNTISSNS